MFPSSPVLRRAAVAGCLAACVAPASALADGGAHASASASVQAKVDAHLSAAKLGHVVQQSADRGRATLRRSQAQLRRAANLAADAATTSEASLAADVNSAFSATVAANIRALDRVVHQTHGRLEQDAAKAIRDDVVLGARVDAVVASRADLGMDDTLTDSLADSDAATVSVVARLSASLRSGDVGPKARATLRQAIAAAVTVRQAVTSRVAELRDAVASSTREILSRTVATLQQGSDAVARSMPRDPSVDVSAEAHANVRASSSRASAGARLVADIVAGLHGSRTFRAHR